MSEDNSFHINKMEGLEKFSNAHSRAFWSEMFNLLRGKPVELLSFDEIRQRLRLREESYKGLQNIPLEQIVGSVGRYSEFTRNFLPKRNEMRERWSRVYAQATSMVGLPPIEVYKVGEVYFVRDGNHRVSVARQLNSKTIEAHVTELPTNININAGMSQEDLIAATAYAAFLAEIGLSQQRPHHQSLELTHQYRYTDLLGHIYMHKSVLEHMAENEVSLEDAAANWYDTVYRPALTVIRKYGMLDILGARTETDLYLWLVDHLLELRDEFGENAPSRRISDAIVDFLYEKKLEIPKDLVREDDPSLNLSRTQLMRAVGKVKEQEARRKRKEQQGDDDQD